MECPKRPPSHSCRRNSNIIALAGRRLEHWRRKPQPIDAEFKEVAEPPEKSTRKPGKSVRLIKGGE